MRKPAKHLLTAAGALALVLSGTMMAPQYAAAQEQAKKTPAEEGKAISFDRRKGNCLSCHEIKGGELPGNIGPALVNMQARFPEKAKLRAQIWDATVNNPNTIMPPFGKHKVLSEDELDKVVEFIYTL